MGNQKTEIEEGEVVLYIFVCPFVLFLLTIVLSVLLRYTDSDYPFCIFKLLGKGYCYDYGETAYSVPVLIS